MGINTDHHLEREEIEIKPNERLALCRCWQSKKFPLCDGSHRRYNEEHNDQIGPMVVCCKDNAN